MRQESKEGESASDPSRMPDPGSEGAVMDATGLWISGVVLPAFQQFAILASIKGRAAVVSSSGTFCTVQVGRDSDPGGSFVARLGTSAPGADDVQAQIPSSPDVFGDLHRDAIDGSQVGEALNRAFEIWLQERT